MSEFNSKSVVITPADVLSGRYNYSFNHPGNNYFRDLIQENREAYQTAPRRAIKNRITNTVIRLVREEPRCGRFLKLNGANEWEVMTDEDVYEKVSHALRGAKKKSGLPRKNRTLALAAGAASNSTGDGEGAIRNNGAGGGGVSSTTYQALCSPFVSRAYEEVMARQRVIFDRLMNEAIARKAAASAAAAKGADAEAGPQLQPQHQQRQQQLESSSSRSYDDNEEEGGGEKEGYHDRERVSAESGDDCSAVSSSSTSSSSYD
jgi:hypothetical protein